MKKEHIFWGSVTKRGKLNLLSDGSPYLHRKKDEMVYLEHAGEKVVKVKLEIIDVEK